MPLMDQFTLEDLLAHPLARSMGLHRQPREFVQTLLLFFVHTDRMRRMEESEIHQDRPALAGVVLELELDEEVRRAARGVRPIDFGRGVGAIVQLVLEQRGWRKTGRRGAVTFTSESRPAGHMQKSERYAPPSHHPEYRLWLYHHRAEDGWVPGRTAAESFKKVAAPGTAGRTGAQEMRDIFRALGDSDVSFAAKMGVLPKTVRSWLRQARIDDGEVTVQGRPVRPSARALERARRISTGVRP